MRIDAIQTYKVRNDETGSVFEGEKAYSPLGLRQRFAGMELTIWNTDSGRVWLVRDGALKLVCNPERKK